MEMKSFRLGKPGAAAYKTTLPRAKTPFENTGVHSFDTFKPG
jgi:hypothetical protein